MMILVTDSGGNLQTRTDFGGRGQDAFVVQTYILLSAQRQQYIPLLKSFPYLIPLHWITSLTVIDCYPGIQIKLKCQYIKFLQGELMIHRVAFHLFQ